MELEHPDFHLLDLHFPGSFFPVFVFQFCPQHVTSYQRDFRIGKAWKSSKIISQWIDVNFNIPHFNTLGLTPEFLQKSQGRTGCNVYFWVVVSNTFYFHPYLREDEPILAHIFQMGLGWNHQFGFFVERWYMTWLSFPAASWKSKESCSESFYVGSFSSIISVLAWWRWMIPKIGVPPNHPF